MDFIGFCILKRNKSPVLSLSKIIVPTDFSKESNEVIVYAAEIAEKTDAEIILLHVEGKNLSLIHI
mgnify:FL=1